MSLNKPKLKTDLGDLFDLTTVDGVSATDARTAFINKLADIVDDYVKSALIVYTSGLVAGSNPVTGTFTGHLQ